MKVVKSLNNNMVLARDEQGDECICQGKGIGWQKRSGDSVDTSLVERRFVPEDQDESRHFQQLFAEIHEEYWAIAEDVVDYGRSHYGVKVSQKIILPLCDHMAGSVERYRKGVVLENPMLWDVKRVYPKEFKFGKYALEVLKERFGVEMKDDEAAFLAFHFVNAQLDGNTHGVSPDTMAKLAGHVIDLVQQSFQITLNEDDWNYQRFLTHLKFFVSRVAQRQTYEEDSQSELYDELKERYTHVYQCVERITDYILINFHYDVGAEERLYLMIHVERVTRRSRNRG
ncbi:MAG: PRD domain-containing protein [Clostridiales bacterium]|nr:PRD domain-containing protein [Clostridiales bacterium]